MPTYHLTSFAADVTPPLGHPLCGGWIEPVRWIDDPLEIRGVVLLGDGKPVVIAAVDWCGLRNQAYRLWRAKLAEAAHTTPEHVALHCIHAHNAPFADVEAQKLIAAAGAPPSLDLAFYDKCLTTSADALRASLPKAERFTHVGYGEAEVKGVASNRRVLGPDGKVKFTRTSATKSKEARDAPEGLIDPLLRTLSFWDGDTPRAALHFYATHPMSYYGDGRVSADFCGLARRRRQADQPTVFQVYLTGAAGNVTAGKYNDGAKENRAVLRDRVHAGMVAAWKNTQQRPVTGWAWQVEPVAFAPRREESFSEAASRRVLADPTQTAAKRNNAAFQLAWLARIRTPVELTSLQIAGFQTIHLPGEPFVEFQTPYRTPDSDLKVCVAGYGDGGMGYIPTAAAFLEGGYEPTVALAAPESEAAVRAAMQKLTVPLP